MGVGVDVLEGWGGMGWWEAVGVILSNRFYNTSIQNGGGLVRDCKIFYQFCMYLGWPSHVSTIGLI